MRVRAICEGCGVCKDVLDGALGEGASDCGRGARANAP